MSQSTSEAQVLASTLLALSQLPGVRCWRQNSGSLLDARGRLIRFGLTGSADILGLIGPAGRLLAVECKSAIGRQSPEQKSFQSMIQKYGGIYILCRSAADALQQVRPYLPDCACDSIPMVNGPTMLVSPENAEPSPPS